MKTDERNPHDWLLLASERLEKADALYKQFGPSYSGVELLEEAVDILPREVLSQEPEG